MGGVRARRHGYRMCACVLHRLRRHHRTVLWSGAHILVVCVMSRVSHVCEHVHRHRRELVCRLPKATSEDVAIERELNGLGIELPSDNCTTMPTELRNVPYSSEHIYFDERQTVWRSTATKTDSAEHQRCAAAGVHIGVRCCI